MKMERVVITLKNLQRVEEEMAKHPAFGFFVNVKIDEGIAWISLGNAKSEYSANLRHIRRIIADMKKAGKDCMYAEIAQASEGVLFTYNWTV